MRVKLYIEFLRTREKENYSNRGLESSIVLEDSDSSVEGSHPASDLTESVSELSLEALKTLLLRLSLQASKTLHYRLSIKASRTLSLSLSLKASNTLSLKLSL